MRGSLVNFELFLKGYRHFRRQRNVLYIDTVKILISFCERRTMLILRVRVITVQKTESKGKGKKPYQF